MSKNDFSGIGLYVTSAVLNLRSDYRPGQDGNPTQEELERALRRELSDHLAPDAQVTVQGPNENQPYQPIKIQYK